MPWMIEDALEGSLRAGRAKGGRTGVMLTLSLPERSVYQLQRLLEDLAAPNGDYFKTRAAVLLSEDLRLAVVDWQEQVADHEARGKVFAGGGGHPKGK